MQLHVHSSEPEITELAETKNYQAWRAQEPDGEVTYHLELGQVTVHFFEEEWREFLDLMRKLVRDA
ncbi:MAG: JHBP domain-containing protein [Chloroflexi bacterium]|nr:JHBP domain-containing protein [Chloroflexota bacterium]